jgi:hypothetical protein
VGYQETFSCEGEFTKNNRKIMAILGNVSVELIFVSERRGLAALLWCKKLGKSGVEMDSQRVSVGDGNLNEGYG